MYGLLANTGITKNHVTGFVVGVGVAATGYYVYMKNKDQVDSFLMNHGIKMPEGKEEKLENLSLEELLLKKESIEDLIAEKEMKLEEQAAEAL